MKPSEKQQQNDDDMRVLLSSPAGRRFFWRVLTQSGLYSSSYAESPTATAYNEGRRSIGLALMQEAQRVDPARYAVALREQLDAAELDAQQSAAKKAQEE